MPKPGAAILLAVGERTWRTGLLETDANHILLSLGELAPVELTSLPIGTRVSCRFHDNQALGTFESRVLGTIRVDGVDCLRLERPAQIARNQRRKHLRVSRRLPMQIRLPLRNDALSRATGKEFVLQCWIRAMGVNISAGGFRTVLSLPRNHSVATHKEALVRFDLGGEPFRNRRLSFIRSDWSTEEVVLVYGFADLNPVETDLIEGFNLSWLHSAQAGEHMEDK